MSSPTIKSVRHDDDIKSEKKFIVYVDETNSAADIADEWFDKHEIWKLKFKCRAWNSIVREGTKIVIEDISPAISAHFGIKPEDFELRYSRKAGCPCGCSPGYVGKILTGYKSGLSQSNVWIEGIPISEAGKSRMQVACAKAEKILVKEIEDHKPVPSVSFSSTSSLQ